MDSVSFVSNLGFKEPKDIVKNFSNNIVIYDIITHNIDADVKVKHTRQKTQYIVTPKDKYAEDFIAEELKDQHTTISGIQYKLKVNKIKKEKSVLVEVHPY